MKELKKVFYWAANNFRYRKGIKKIEKILRSHPNLVSEEVLCDLGLLYDHYAMKQTLGLRKKYEATAFKLYQRALKINPRSYRAVWGMGRIWWHRKNKKALPYALRAYYLKKKSGENAGLMAQSVGLVYWSLGNESKAQYWFHKGLREDKKEFGCYLNLFNFYDTRNNKKKGNFYRRKLLELYNKQPPSFKKTKWGKTIEKISSREG